MDITVFDLKRYSVNDGPGIRTTVFMKGCPLRCIWCHNPESINAQPETVHLKRKLGQTEIATTEVIGRIMPLAELMTELNKDRIFYEETGGGITFSGGEPLFSPQALEAALTACKEQKLHTALDTCGYASREVFERIIHLPDLFLFDIKFIVTSKHLLYTGKPNTQILENLQRLHDLQKNVIIRIPIITEINDSESHIYHIINYLQKNTSRFTEVHLLPYHSSAKGKYMRLGKDYLMESIASASTEKIETLKKLFENNNFTVKTGG